MQSTSGIAVIPARGGSQRIPGKNIREIAGMPAIAHVIRTCRASGALGRIVVSTNDPDIAEIARQAGAEVPFMRPIELSDDHTGILPVVQHAVRELGVDDRTQVACVYATALTLDAMDIVRARERLSELVSASFVISVTEYDAPVQRALVMSDDGSISFVNPAMAHTRSQDVPVRWHDAGQFIWGRADTWTAAPSVWDSAIGFAVPHWRVVDIDTEDDWRRAELVLSMIKATGDDR